MILANFWTDGRWHPPQSWPTMVGEMDAAAALTPDELLAADALFAELLGEEEDAVVDLAMQRALRRLDAGDEPVSAAV